MHALPCFDSRFRDVLRREARDVLRGGPPTVELLRPVGPEIPSDERVFQVLDLCLQVGEVLMSSGEAAAQASATMTRLAAACGVDTVEVDITFTSITMCCRRGRAAAPVTAMRLVRHRTTDLTRLASVTRIVEQVVRREMSLSAADDALAQAVRAPHPYPRWVATAGWAGLAAAVAVLLGGPPVIGVTAFVVTAVLDRVGRILGRWGVASFFLQVVGGLVATLSTIGLFAAGVVPPGTDSSLVIAASITVLLSGLPQPRHNHAPAGGRLVGHHPAAARPDCVPRLLPVGLGAGAGRGERSGRDYARAGHRSRPRRRCDARPVRRPTPPAAQVPEH